MQCADIDNTFFFPDSRLYDQFGWLKISRKKKISPLRHCSRKIFLQFMGGK